MSTLYLRDYAGVRSVGIQSSCHECKLLNKCMFDFEIIKIMYTKLAH